MDKEILKGMADNPALFDAVKRVLSQHVGDIYQPTLAHSDELLGQMTRARMLATECIDRAFDEIARYRTIKTNPQGENPAR